MKQLQKEFDNFIEALNESGNYEKNVIKNIKKHISSRFNNILDSLEDCESPIEQIFSLELSKVMGTSRLIHDADVLDIRKQVNFTFNEKEEIKHRVDFLLTYKDMKNGITEKIVIECDGHDFHEKTKKQAERDKKRDRRFQRCGFTVVRFTGSEIVRNPFACAREVEEILLSTLEKYEKSDKKIEDSDLPF